MDVCASSIPSASPAAYRPPSALPVQPGAAARGTAPLAIGVIGPGHVGGALLAQLRAAQHTLRERQALDLRLCGVVRRRQMWLDCDDAELNARRNGAQTWRPADLDAFAAYVRGEDDRRPAVLVDCSASEAVAERYAGWLAAGIHVVTPSKLAGSGPLARWRAIHGACASGARFRYEATVCAGLPVVQTLRDLLDTGDELHEVNGMFSGTLAWLCNRHDGSRPFSAWLGEARALGYTEPDPRDDLSGLDVARKLVILAREAGHALTLEDVEVESLVPAPLATVSLEEFLRRQSELDADMGVRLARARAEGGVLRHVAHLDRSGRASVRLAVLPASHAFAHSRATDNVVQFTTRRYCDNPLQVQGPGAGPDVTAAGVFADILRIAESLAQHP